jgi:hypothetical protein
MTQANKNVATTEIAGNEANFIHYSYRTTAVMCKVKLNQLM